MKYRVNRSKPHFAAVFRVKLLELDAAVLVPPMILDDLYHDTSKTETLGRISIPNYFNRLTYFAFQEPRDYEGFREFLRNHAAIFMHRYPLLENMTSGQIDYVLRRVREERIASQKS